MNQRLKARRAMDEGKYQGRRPDYSALSPVSPVRMRHA